jgi:hypothetical protein
LLVLTDDSFDPIGVAFDIDFSGDRPFVTIISAANAEARFLVHDPVAASPKRIKLIQGASGKPGLRDQQHDAMGRSFDRLPMPHR